MADAAATAIKPPPELSSILNQVQALQGDRERLMKELEESKSKVDKLQVTLRAYADHHFVWEYVCLFFVMLAFAIAIHCAYVQWKTRRRKESARK
jgi:hypothetical protein